MSVSAARVYLVTLFAIVLGLTSLPHAVAAPAHDERSGAKRISLGEPDKSSNATATDGTDDPACEWSTIHRTIWYRFRPSRNMNVVARARPLDGTDVEMAVLTPTPEGLGLIACEDFGWDGEAENIRFHAKADTKYYFMIGNAAPDQPGGRIKFDVHRPVSVSPRLDDVSWSKKADGDAVITGRIGCSVTTSITLVAQLSQTGSSATGSKRVGCKASGKTPWLLAVNRYEGDAFHAGKASLSVRFIHDDDEVQIRRSTRTRVVICTRIGTVGRDRMFGSNGRDHLCGLQGHDYLVGRGGRDVLIGHDGPDEIAGGGKGDRLEGGGGNDALRGDAGRDSLLGNAGRDRLEGGSGRDRCRGGTGLDRLVSCETHRR